MLTQFVSIYLKIKKPLHTFRERGRFELDKNGVPFRNYKNINGNTIGIQRSPVSISQKALEYIENYKMTKNEKSKKFFFSCLDWLVENAVTSDNYSILHYNFPWPLYELEKPWFSGMAQGLGIQALIIGHKISNNEKYLDTAKLFLKSFFVEVKDGGITYKDSDDRWWYEEYASKNGKKSRVLNGMVFAVLGIYDFYKYTNDKDAKILFERGIESLKNDLVKYDFGNGYSYYDVLKRPAGKYHKIHVEQMKQLYDITDEEIFQKYYDKWKSFDYFKNLPSLIIEEIKNSEKTYS